MDGTMNLNKDPSEAEETSSEAEETPSEAEENPSEAEKNPFELIKSAKTTVGEIIFQYKYQIKHHKDLPTQFDEVNACLPRTKLALNHAINKLDWDEASSESIQLLAVGLKSKVNKLQSIFTQVAEHKRNADDQTVLECYIAVLRTLADPKSHHVEVLMLGILRDLETLFSKKPLKPGYSQTFELKDVIEKISKLEPSGQETTRPRNVQNNTYGATGHQYNGKGHVIYAGAGNYTINNHHVSVFRDDSTGKVMNRPYYIPSQMDEGNIPPDGNLATTGQVVAQNQLPHPQDQAHLSNSQAVSEGTAMNRGRPRGRGDFQIAIICALPLEYDVVSLLFDQFWDEDESYGRARGDTNTYTTGRMGHYNVVLVLLPNMGTIAAAGAAASFRSSYSNLQLAFLIGICGGVPWNGEDEIHLGDVVISKSAVQYDLGDQYHKTFVIKDTVDDSLGRPNKNIRSLVKSFETERIRDQLRQKACLYLKDIQSAAARKRRRFNYQYPGIDKDRLFIATYRHKHRGPQPCNFCDTQPDGFCQKAAQTSCAELGCDETQLVNRSDLETRGSPEEPEIFIGRIASGNMVMKSGEHRDKIAGEQNVIALEMEGAGVWDEIPCIIVKGVCDYADSHRHDLWQRYAAATAASVMKAVLGRYIMTDR
ncbi:hypothetical protein TGAMA5MH_04593 [Trichoderma gamsii]|uniref:Nucleoside phosphorylase domain-containing protein n=1 Tax=Trichoderma gamsii TaxID=398673 RepID=A0A2K0TDM3_9HYPO|nr:hypothetical protein TGAMA5MH_04593 [Trichoderma gamsii]